MAQTRPTRTAIVVMVGALAADRRPSRSGDAPRADWNLAFFAVLLAFSIFSDLTAVTTESKLKISGSFLALVLAMVFLGGTPAALIGVATILTGWLRWRDEWHYLLDNVLTYALFPLIGGIVFHEGVVALGLTTADPWLLPLRLRPLPARPGDQLRDDRQLRLLRRALLLLDQAARSLPPVLPSEFASAMLAVARRLHLRRDRDRLDRPLRRRPGHLPVPARRSCCSPSSGPSELELRSKQLASFQVGMLSAMLRTLDLRDQMTARHSAAVARYSRAIAQRAGYSRREEELVHIAALLHDIGKFILPDRILKANVPLTDEDWMLIKRHPQQGARVVSSLDGYGPVADIILAHHERIDGKGYPRGLAGDEIPELARIISVADTYDVMTARDSYRTPMSSYDAIVELRRVAGKQLDARFVEIFIELLEGKDVSFQHGEAADFEKELALEARIAETASPGGEASRFQVAGVN